MCRLQARIVKAIQEGRWGKVKALQYLLTHSFSGKALAIRRVTENQGKGTPGVDREIWDTPEKKATALQALRQRGYNPQPLRRVYIPKKNGKMRPLGIPTMRDRAMQALYLQALDPIAETMADPNSYGFRKERSTADAIEQCHIVLSNRGGARWIFEGDIKSCFDRISHEWLMAQIPMCKTILQKWLKAGFMEKHVFYATEEGTPQGGICSPVVANMALDGLERELRGRYPKASALSRKAKVNLVRYADDFIITGSSKKLLEEEVKPLVESFLKERGLELSAEKTHITRIEDGFDFLGQNVRDYGGTIVVKPSRKNVATFLEKVRGIIKASKHVTAGHLIVNLNPVIRGWANYYRQESTALPRPGRAAGRVVEPASGPSHEWTTRSFVRYGSGPNGGTPRSPDNGSKTDTLRPSTNGIGSFTAQSPAGRRSSNRSGSSPPQVCRSSDIPRSKGKRILTTPPGNRTSRNVSA